MATSTSPTTMKKIERAHQMYREGKYEDALGYYTEALSMAKTKPQKIALHSNRAACFLKLHLFQKAAEECTWVLELDHKHTGALMLRAQTLVTLKEYQSALFDVNRLIELNSSSDVYRNLQSRLKTQLSLATIPEADTELEEEEEEEEEDEDEKYEVEVEEMKEEEVKIEKKDDIKEKNENILKGEKIEKASEKSVSWQAIAKPKGHSRLDYSRWDQVEDDSSEDEDEDDDENCQPQYRFRVRKVGVHAVK